METKDICTICPRQCKINRNLNLGVCNESNTIRIAKVIKNFMWEEPCITGLKGTLAIFFSGCNLRCDYCQNYEISRGGIGQNLSIDEFVSLINQNQDNHSSIDLITPTHFSNALLKAFEKIDKKIPIVWNTNSYETVENIHRVSKFVDVFLADFKYSDDTLALQYSKCNDYFNVCTQAIDEMCKQKPDVFDEDLMTQGVVIRHLVLPGHIENSFKVLDTISDHFPTRKLSLMSQFTPNGQSPLNRKLKPVEYKAVLAHLEKLGLKNGYIQQFDSADECFVPEFV